MPESESSGQVPAQAPVAPRRLELLCLTTSASLQGIPLADCPAPLGTAKFMQPIANDGPDYYLLMLAYAFLLAHHLYYMFVFVEGLG